MFSHPLDRPVWSALTTRLSSFAVDDSSTTAEAVRIDPEVGLFVAAADAGTGSVAALTDLCRRYPGSGLVEREDGPMVDVLPMGASVALRIPLLQMTMPRLTRGGSEVADIRPLEDADAAEMEALAAMTQPGPFFSRTRALGGFIGVRRDGRLIAMAGHRLKTDGFTEISAVCTHPDHRGQGLAGALMRRLAEAILADGEIPFLHARAAHETTIAFYRTLGFEARATMTYTVLSAE